MVRGKNNISESETERVNFGFQRVKPHEKISMVQDVFSRVAHRYDLMNDVMSLGFHRLWKHRLARLIFPKPRQKILDVGGGTGDVACYLQDVANRNLDIVICDINPDMLAVGQTRCFNKGYIRGLSWVEADATNLPFEKDHFDIVVSAFCFRNITHTKKALGEVLRVLKPGGHFWCMEFSKLQEPLLEQAYDFWSFEIIPRLGRLLAKDESAYRYLVESIRRHPDQERFGQLFKAVGFESVALHNEAYGIVAIHDGLKALGIPQSASTS